MHGGRTILCQGLRRAEAAAAVAAHIPCPEGPGQATQLRLAPALFLRLVFVVRNQRPWLDQGL